MSDLGALLGIGAHGGFNRWRRLPRRERLVILGLGALGALFWVGLLLFIVFLLHLFFQHQSQGAVSLGFGMHALGKKLFNFVLVAYFLFLIFSNVINAVSSFFLAEDLQLLGGLPILPDHFFLARFFQTFLASSWMMFLFGLPLFIAFGIHYQIYFHAPWTYYLWMTLLFIPYLILPASFGVMLAFLIVNAFPAHKARDIFGLMGVIFAALFFIAFRLINPEGLLRAESIDDLLLFLEGMEAPSNYLLPNEWIASGLYDLLLGLKGVYLYNWALLMLTAAATVAVAGWLFHRTWLSGFHKTQESKRVFFSRQAFFQRALERLAALLPRRAGALIAKDIRVFFRDPSQWSQLLLLGSLIVVYLLYYSSFPLDQITFATPFLKTAGAGSFMAYLNIAMTSFVVTSLGARFIYPTVSLEGRAYWVIATAPITSRAFLRSKFQIAFFPTLLVAECLIVGSNLILGADLFLHLFSVAAMLLLCFTIVGLGVGLGARFPMFRAESAVKIGVSFGGIVYMALSMAVTIAILVILFFPARMYYEYGKLWEQIPLIALLETLAQLLLAIAGALALVGFALRAGRRKLESLEGI